MQITLEIKCPTCLSDSIKKNGIKVDGKQNYQCKDCKSQYIGDHALSYLGCNSGITRKILQFEPYRVCRRVNILRDYPDDKIKIYP